MSKKRRSAATEADPPDDNGGYDVDMEVLVRDSCTADRGAMEAAASAYMRLRLPELDVSHADTVVLAPPSEGIVERLRVCAAAGLAPGSAVRRIDRRDRLHVYLYSLDRDGGADEFAGGGGADDGGDGSALATFRMWAVPSAELEGVWESIVSEPAAKQRLLAYALTAARLADRGVDPMLVACNRVVLLHGPPGSGKTSLCKALAHKLAIRLGDRYSSRLLLEINAHSLFSKWFSESGKLVSHMFERVRELLACPGQFVFLLIDEVESLSSARRNAAAGTEPSDAIRVVNALLTQLDRLRMFPNVLVLCTSNLTGAIDLAFIDRADIKLFVGNPSADARAAILRSSLDELLRVGAVTAPQARFDVDASLRSVAEACDGLSGRALRKLPLAAMARALSCGGGRGGRDELPLARYVALLRESAVEEASARAEIDAQHRAVSRN